MRSAIKGKHSLFTTVSIAALSISLGSALAAHRDQPAAAHVHSKVARVISAIPRAVPLYNQNSDDAGVAVSSTIDKHFQGTWGADDFPVPEGHRWIVWEVDVGGAYFPGTPAKTDPHMSEQVSFYTDTDGDGLPDHLLRQCAPIKGRDHNGSFAIKLKKFCPTILQGGRRYWISVAAIIHGSRYDQWEWETRNTKHHDPAVWKTTEGAGECSGRWGVMTSCVDIGEGPDFMFALKGLWQFPKPGSIGTSAPAN